MLSTHKLRVTLLSLNDNLHKQYPQKKKKEIAPDSEKIPYSFLCLLGPEGKAALF